MTGVLNIKGEQYYDANNVYGIHMHNSDIFGLNAIYMNDDASSQEGINFYHS